eukprot:gnl/Chilomastix_caulleri/2782.p2 GENE.gnl/Chilomastix_caulleri/2782~~gnl/Chilomastix_caulleri/2782.p2  ORF type:complete len:109 (+),score=41.50 gnl/Chilomastix_caulleri/2782:548-874(+)
MKHCSLSSDTATVWALTEGVGRGDFTCVIDLETKIVTFHSSKTEVTVGEILGMCERATEIHRSAIKGLVYRTEEEAVSLIDPNESPADVVDAVNGDGMEAEGMGDDDV